MENGIHADTTLRYIYTCWLFELFIEMFSSFKVLIKMAFVCKVLIQLLYEKIVWTFKFSTMQKSDIKVKSHK